MRVRQSCSALIDEFGETGIGCSTISRDGAGGMIEWSPTSVHLARIQEQCLHTFA